MVAEVNGMNIGMDYARGKEGDAVYFYTIEEFLAGSSKNPLPKKGGKEP